MKTTVTTLVATIALAAAVTVIPGKAQSTAPSATDKIEISGQALNMNNTATGANTRILIRVNAWSNASQREHLITSFLEQQQEGLAKQQALLKEELEKQPELGRFNFPNYMGPDPDNIMRLGTDIRYAMSFPLENGGRRIVIITPRIIGFRETVNNPRRIDYPFSLFEMRFDKDGKGEGKMAYFTQIQFDKKANAIGLENYGTEPTRLRNLELKVVK